MADIKLGMASGEYQSIALRWPNGWNVDVKAEIELEVDGAYNMTVKLNGVRVATVDRSGKVHWPPPDREDETGG